MADEDIGPGDVVCAVSALNWPQGGKVIQPGERAIVVEVSEPTAPPGAIVGETFVCETCGGAGAGLVLAEYPLPPNWRWCPCGWRKVGGSRADTVRQFEDALRHAPARAPRLEPV